MKSAEELRRERLVAWVVVAILAPLACATFVTTKFVIRRHRIPTAAMVPTVHPGDHVWLNQLAFAFGASPRVGDVVAFRSPLDRTRMLNRVVAGPGDTIEMRDNVLFLNGKRRHEPYIMITPEVQAVRSFDRLEVPPGHYFVLGDNRDNANDSRYIGFIPEDDIYGRTFYVLHVGRCEE